jgi:heme oxygenase
LTLLERLKEETRASHVDLERRLDILKRLRTREDYRGLLEALYGVCCPLERELGTPEVARWLPDVESRLRASSLRLDLQVLGNLHPEELPLAPVPPLESLSEEFGCLYVLEGSKLGGQVISREIARQLHYTPSNGGAYFASHGSEIGNMWMRFREAIEAFAVAYPEHHDRVVHSAIATFDAFGDWIERKTWTRPT